MRTLAAVLCVLIATALTPVAIGASWVSLRVDDTDEYVATMAPLGDDPDLRAELGDEVATATIAALEQHLPVGLPDGTRRMVRQASTMVVESEGFPTFWREANADAHRQFLAIAHGQADPDGDGRVTLDLSPLVMQVLDRLAARGLPVGLLPAIQLRVPIAREADVETAAGPYRLVEGSAPVLAVLWCALVGLAVLIGQGWRGRLRLAGVAGLGVALGAGLVRLAAGPLTDTVVDQVDPGNQGLVRLIALMLVDSLEGFATGFVFVGLGLGLGLLLASLWPSRRSGRPTPAAYDESTLSFR